MDLAGSFFLWVIVLASGCLRGLLWGCACKHNNILATTFWRAQLHLFAYSFVWPWNLTLYWPQPTRTRVNCARGSWPFQIAFFASQSYNGEEKCGEISGLLCYPAQVVTARGRCPVTTAQLQLLRLAGIWPAAAHVRHIWLSIISKLIIMRSIPPETTTYACKLDTE